MKNAVIIHGMPSKEEYFDLECPSPSNNHWLPWIQRQLLLNGVLAQTPEMPEPYLPDYAKWSAVFEQFDIGRDTSLVGHSCGAGFLVKWLSAHHVPVGKVALVAPWIDPYQYRAPAMFSGWRIDPTLAARTQGMHLFVSSDDGQDKIDTAILLETNIKGLKSHWYSDQGHFLLSSMKTPQFPELIDFLVK